MKFWEDRLDNWKPFVAGITTASALIAIIFAPPLRVISTETAETYYITEMKQETYSVSEPHVAEEVYEKTEVFADTGGLTRDGHCGALSGGTMAISYLFGRGKEDFGNIRKQLRACILSKKLHYQFIEKYGTCRCADIQTKLVGRFFNLYEPTQMETALKAGMPDKCSTLIGEIAKMTTKIILEGREGESQKKKEAKNPS